jgi:hypothetical protein
MKVRSGFVSNSSSSSFIVAFPCGFVPTAVAIQDYLFGTRQEITVDEGDESITCTEAATLIYQQMSGQAPNDHLLIDEALSGYLPGEPEYYKYVTFSPYDQEHLTARRAQEKAFRQARIDYQQKWWAQKQQEMRAAQYDLYVFEFGDNHGVIAPVIERGRTFSKVPYAKISHH